MISLFSEAQYLMNRSPHPRERFFEYPVFDQNLGQGFFQLAGLGSQGLDLIGRRLTRGIAGETLLASLQELLRPAVIEVLDNALFAPELGDAGFAAQAF